MFKRTMSLSAALLLAAGALAAAAAETASVTLPLADYLSLVQHIEEANRLQEERRANAEPEVAEVVEETRRIVIGSERAEISSSLAVEIRGERLGAVALPVTGTPWQTSVEPAGPAALWHRKDGLALAVTEPGRYTVTIRATAPLVAGVGVQQLILAPLTAAVATTEVELPAELAWSCPGAAVAADRVNGDRRTLELALNRHTNHSFELRREVRGGAADELLAKTVVVTLLAINRTGVDRHDVVLYEVSRGALAELEVNLPQGMIPIRLASDEGELPAVADAGKVIAQRRSLLTGTGFLVISSHVDDGGVLDLNPVVPAVELRSRYLSTSTAVAAEVAPSPADHWLQVDLADLPEAVATAADRLDLGAAWRWQGDPTPSTVTVARPAPAELVPIVIDQRDTITLLTVDGTLLHRDRLDLTTAASALEIELADGATLWSSLVDGVAVRPLERSGSTVIPLPFGARHSSRVEVVVVEQRVVPPGRSSIELTLPQLAAPVLAHRWRLLLPEDNRYRFVGSPLAPAPRRGWQVEPWRAAAPTSGGTATVISASGGRGEVRGSVLDNEGLALPGVIVTIASSALTGGPKSAITNANGTYSFNGLPSGHYRLEGNLPGFMPVALELELSSQQTVRADLNMVPEQFSGEIEVVAEVPLVDTSKTSTGTTFGTGTPRGGHHRSSSRAPKAEPPSQVRQAAGDLDELSQGLVGGVRPVPVDIPERGKAFDLEGALPPPVVSVQLEVKAGKD